ncbi:Nickel/cobalt efflux system rcnA [Cedecea lapagei]|uniref:Nickel/cobalt efflux system n=1 Tax=Cedecea lapagei TaxID=158823 RepID=A0A447V168_9ENTR|nr:nickel/cobalt efflux protein RcnA [Cedecea lapagei]VEB96922.1 Nickel/cobalt efflux system rcnA [Cedecea lapagei]
MTEFTTLFQQGNAWFFIPSAILLGALHGLEPGHSKTMMAAFIIAIKGTARQAAMLGLAATLSHTAIVWLIAFGGMYISKRFTAESAEPWLQLISAVIILATAFWMFWRTWRGEKNWLAESQESGHHHHDETKRIDTGHGYVELSIFEEGQAPRWRLRNLSRRKLEAGNIALETQREGRESSQVFKFVDCGGYMESTSPIPEPHNFNVRLSFGHRGHSHDYEVEFHEHHHDHSGTEGLDVGSKEYQDAHELAHANDIKRRFSNKEVTNGQILLFGLTGGLIPCPAAITVLLICMQLKALTLGATLVVCFSLGLALTLVTVGVSAAVGVRQVAKRWSGFSAFARKAPYFSSALIAAMGLYMAIQGWGGLGH